ncbi:MAG TPA: DUF5312 family protein, partial [Treponemataceae bacterium]|nr:DUF5312 family protein [Treponemataceae bacterium]
ENTLKNSTSLYKNNMLQPSFAQAFYMLQKQTRALEPYLLSITNTADAYLKEKIYVALIETGYNSEFSKNKKLFSYTERKERMKTAHKTLAEIEHQRKNLDDYINHIKTPPFLKIQTTLQNLDLFISVCNFNYINCLHLFDSSFFIDQENEPSFAPVEIATLETILLDFYFITANLTIDGALARAVLAIIRIAKKEPLSAQTSHAIITHIKTIRAVINQILTSETLTHLLCLIKQDPSFEPQAMVSNKKYLEKYKNKAKQQFAAEENRIQSEIQDEKLSTNITKLFGKSNLNPLKGYTQELNVFLQENSPCSFLWITPLEIIKNFLDKYFNENITSLLNDIVVEGFFLNPMYKTSFSSLVYTCSEFSNTIATFEESFSQSGPNSTALIKGYVKDSKKDSEFEKNLQMLIDSVNKKAKDMVQTISGNLAQLHTNIQRVLADSKQSSPEEIENIKVLLQSTRNYDKTEFLERNLQKWHMFIEIMKNYAIIDKSN